MDQAGPAGDARRFNGFNKYLGVPALKMGLGRLISNPLTGYLMILRTRGRKSGEMRDAPLGYTIVGDSVYCIAGFGRRTHWFQNVLVDPHVEVILPGRSFSGVAEEVTEAGERLRVLPPLLRSMGAVAGMVGMGNPWRDSPAEIAAQVRGNAAAADPRDGDLRRSAGSGRPVLGLARRDRRIRHAAAPAARYQAIGMRGRRSRRGPSIEPALLTRARDLLSPAAARFVRVFDQRGSLDRL